MAANLPDLVQYQGATSVQLMFPDLDGNNDHTHERSTIAVNIAVVDADPEEQYCVVRKRIGMILTCFE